MPAILAHYGADVPMGRGARWVPVKCPWHEDNQASGAYCEDLDAYRCMVCEEARGNAVTLLMRVEGLSAREADARATEISGLPGTEQPGVGRAGTGRRGRAYLPPRLRRGGLT